MSFLDEVQAETGTTGQCLTCKHLRDMPDELRDEVLAVLASSAPNPAIARALTKRGYKVSDDAIRNHRKSLHVVQ